MYIFSWKTVLESGLLSQGGLKERFKGGCCDHYCSKKKKAGIITALKEKCPPHHHKHIYLLFSIFVDHLEY